MTKGFWTAWRDRRGQALVEFSLAAAVFFLLAFGIYEFSRAWNAYEVISDAARGGARTAVIGNSNQTFPNDTVTKQINAKLARWALDTTLAQITVTGWRTGQGTLAQVSIQYPFQFRIVGSLLKWTTGQGSVTLSASYQLRNE